MSTTLYKYQIYCTTEEKYVSGWGTAAPTACYNNTSHSVNTNSVQVIDTINTNEVTINQNNSSIAGKFHIESVNIANIQPNSTGTVTHVFDVATSLHSFNFALNAAEAGDTFSIAVNPNTPLGLITQDAKANDIVLSVSPYVIGYMFPGFYVTVSDGTNSDTTIKILSRNLVNSTITIKTPLINSYSASNTQIFMSYYCIKDMPIILGTTYSFGGEIINASNVPAGTTALFSFTNNSSTTVKNIAVYMTGLI